MDIGMLILCGLALVLVIFLAMLTDSRFRVLDDTTATDEEVQALLGVVAPQTETKTKTKTKGGKK